MHAELATAQTWDLISIMFTSSAGAFYGAPPLLLTQVYATDFPPQGFVVTGLASNGLYAATRAHDIDL